MYISTVDSYFLNALWHLKIKFNLSQPFFSVMEDSLQRKRLNSESGLFDYEFAWNFKDSREIIISAFKDIIPDMHNIHYTYCQIMQWNMDFYFDRFKFLNSIQALGYWLL